MVVIFTHSQEVWIWIITEPHYKVRKFNEFHPRVIQRFGNLSLPLYFSPVSFRLLCTVPAKPSWDISQINWMCSSDITVQRTQMKSKCWTFQEIKRDFQWKLECWTLRRLISDSREQLGWSYEYPVPLRIILISSSIYAYVSFSRTVFPSGPLAKVCLHFSFLSRVLYALPIFPLWINRCLPPAWRIIPEHNHLQGYSSSPFWWVFLSLP